jgi:hypothetical protein
VLALAVGPLDEVRPNSSIKGLCGTVRNEIVPDAQPLMTSSNKAAVTRIALDLDAEYSGARRIILDIRKKET